jgi:hypothetical protein
MPPKRDVTVCSNDGGSSIAAAILMLIVAQSSDAAIAVICASVELLYAPRSYGDTRQMGTILPKVTARKVDDGDPLGALTIYQFCSTYGLSRSAVYKQIWAGRLRTMKVGARTLISRRAAAEWERLCEREPA